MNESAGLDFGAAVRLCLRKYADFSGRAPRSEFWWWVVFQWLAGSALNMVVLTFIGIVVPHALRFTFLNAIVLSPKYSNLGTLTWVIFFLPWLAVTVRRLHDGGHSGWCSLLGWTPLLIMVLLGIAVALHRQPALGMGVNHDINLVLAGLSLLLLAGWLRLLVVLCTRGTVGDNRYGPDPLRGF